MKNNIKLIIIVLLGICILNTSCKKDPYIIGGGINNAKSNLTTYDYLKANQLHLFDTLLLLIDKAGMKDIINQSGITFFAPTDYSIHNYMLMKAYSLGYASYTVDSMYKYDMASFKDSLGMYIVKQTLSFDGLTAQGTSFPTLLGNVSTVVTNEPVKSSSLGYYGAITNAPTIIYNQTLNIHTRCQTFGVQTTTGVLGVLGNEHILFFNH